MADPLSATASILTLIEFAAKSCKSLYDAVQSYQNHPKRVRSLQEELTALHCVLIPLQDFKDETDKTFVVLKAPLLSCGRACEGFEKMLTKYSTHGGTDKRSFRDWASFSFRGSNVEGFTTTIAAYRGTISVALGSANLRIAKVTAVALQEYKDLITRTMSDLEERFDELNERLASVPERSRRALPEPDETRNELQEERDATSQCISFCESVSSYIEQARPIILRDTTSSTSSALVSVTTLQGLISSRLVTNEAVIKCQFTLDDAKKQLQQRLDSLEIQMGSESSNAVSAPRETDPEQQEILDERESFAQSLSIVKEANEKAQKKEMNLYEDVESKDDSTQIIVSTVEQLITARRIKAGANALQMFGQVSNETVQVYAPRRSTQPVTTNAEVGSPGEGKFETRYGVGNTLSAPATGGAERPGT